MVTAVAGAHGHMRCAGPPVQCAADFFSNKKVDAVKVVQIYFSRTVQVTFCQFNWQDFSYFHFKGHFSFLFYIYI